MTTIAHPELEGLERYKFGWADSDVAGESARRGLSEEVVRDISALKHEPEWMLDLRLKGGARVGLMTAVVRIRATTVNRTDTTLRGRAVRLPVHHRPAPAEEEDNRLSGKARACSRRS